MKKPLRQLLACALCFAVLLGLMPELGAMALSGNGTEASPYLVATKADLYAVRNDLDACYKMTADIVFTEEDFAEGGAYYNGGKGWAPIGTEASPFIGSFDGDGHTITGLKINISGATVTAYAGLFGYINNATVKNLGMVDGIISVATTGQSIVPYVGSIAGHAHNESVISGCYNTGTVAAYSYGGAAYVGGLIGETFYDNGETEIGTVISDCYNTGAVSSSNNSISHAGGIAGYTDTVTTAVKDSYNTGNITAESTGGKSYAGGITGGNNRGNITRCYNAGDIYSLTTVNSSQSYFATAAGIADSVKSWNGVNYSVSDCYNVGAVEAVSTQSSYAAGIVNFRSTNGSVVNCYNIGAIKVSNGGGTYSKDADGITAHKSSGAGPVTNCYSARFAAKTAVDATVLKASDMKTESAFSGFDFGSVWTMDGRADYPFPELQGMNMAKTIVSSVEIIAPDTEVCFNESIQLSVAGDLPVTWAIVEDDSNYASVDAANGLLSIRNLPVGVAPDMPITVKASYANNPAIFNEIIINAVGTKDSGAYTAGVSRQTDVRKGEIAYVNVAVNHSKDTSFAAGEIVFAYDSSKLSFNADASTLGTATVKDENGVLTLEDYGADKAFGNAVYVLAFNADVVGTASVSITDAGFADKVDVETADLATAEKFPEQVSIVIEPMQHRVLLPEGFVGAEFANDGEAYTFNISADGAYYQYGEVTATVGGGAANVKNNGDGSYTIENVGGEVAVFGSRTLKPFNVTFDGSGKDDVSGAESSAYYTVSYSFELPSKTGWAYELESIKIGNTENYDDYTVDNGVYTIPGEDIKGDIVIVISKAQTTATVEFNGDGAGAATGNSASANVGEAYTLVLAPEAGYAYTVTATMGGSDITASLQKSGDNYTITEVTGDIVFTIDCEVILDGVSVSEYVQLSGTKLWLVVDEIELEAGKAATYNGNVMYWSDNYGENGAYCYLVVADSLTADAAKALIGIKSADAEKILYDMDVNGTGRVDASDAQLVYNMYKTVYTGFTDDVTMKKFLKADADPNHDGILDTKDAVAIVNYIFEN